MTWKASRSEAGAGEPPEGSVPDFDAVTRCPSCGSGDIAPLFWVDVDTMDCADCGAIFSGRLV